MNYQTLNEIQTYVPAYRQELIDFAFKEKKMLVAINAEKILNAQDDLKTIINQNIGYPDGIGAVWALRKKKEKKATKIPGCELWLDIIKLYSNKKTFYLIGGTQQTIESVVKKLSKEYPGINICNYRNGYISSKEESEKLIQDVSEKKPDVVFVAMGSPKQEILMSEMQKKHKAVYQGLGGSFDVFIGNVQRAPIWYVNNNLEWAYRLVKQPHRIFRQIHLVKFFVLLHINKF